jgi:ankyrin repeat protein
MTTVMRGAAINEHNKNKSEISERNAQRPRIYTATVTGNYKDVMQLIKDGESINSRFLKYVIIRNYYFLIAAVDAAVPLFLRGDNNNTPLIVACELRRSAICKALIDNGAEVHVTNKLGKSALHKAVYTGLLPIVNMLLDKGVSINIQDHVYGNTPLHKACEYDQYEAACLLIAKGGDVNIKNKVIICNT